MPRPVRSLVLVVVLAGTMTGVAGCADEGDGGRPESGVSIPPVPEHPFTAASTPTPGTTVTDPNGSVYLTGRLPADFPRERVPLVGTVEGTTTMPEGQVAGSGWMVVTRSPGPLKECRDRAAGVLDRAGFKVSNRFELAGGSLVEYRGGRWTVAVTVYTTDAGRCRLTYQIYGG